MAQRQSRLHRVRTGKPAGSRPGPERQAWTSDVSATAPRSDPGCPGPCLAYFVWPRFGFDYGTARGELIRLYFTSLGTGTKTHTLVISIDTPNAKTFSAVIPAAGKIIDSVQAARDRVRGLAVSSPWLPTCDHTDLAVRYPWNEFAAHPATRTKSGN